jgi:4-amino-4-deoxy-L-arabinose transferase-like glycosyltransferase
MSKAALTLKAALPLTLVAAVAVLARTWQLLQNDFGRQYYAAGVRSMLDSWHNFLFNAFDPAGFVSIDKPPVAIWLQVASAKLLGFSALSILLTQVMAGLAAVLIVYILVQKYWGRTAAAVAALSLALSPINVAVDRSNNTESCLILVLLAAVWLGTRAAETGRLATFCAAMAAIGIGFNVKMGAALVLAPVLALTFQPRPAGRSRHLACPATSHRRHHLRCRLAVMGDLLRSHAGPESTLCGQYQTQFHAGARIGAQWSGALPCAISARGQAGKLLARGG